MVRNSVKYVSYKDRKAVTAGLKAIYSAPSAELAEVALDEFADKWDSKYPMISKSWRARWPEVIPFLKFPPEIRTGVYTTNAIESLNYTIQRTKAGMPKRPISGLAVSKATNAPVEALRITWHRQGMPRESSSTGRCSRTMNLP